MDDLIKMIFDDNLITEEQFKEISALKKPYGERLGSLLLTGGFLTSKEIERFFKENNDHLFELFQEWLSVNSKIADAIRWWEDGSKENPQGVPKAYSSWSLLKKTQLSSTFWKILLDIYPGLDEAPPCTVNLYGDGKVFSTEFKRALRGSIIWHMWLILLPWKWKDWCTGLFLDIMESSWDFC